MKKNFYLLLFSVLFFIACKKNEDNTITSTDAVEDLSLLNPKQEKNGFAINYTGVWCYYCGAWGADRIHKYAEDTSSGVTICAHVGNDVMKNEELLRSFLSDREQGSGVPSFWVGDDKTNSSSAMISLLQQLTPCGIDYNYSIE